MYLLILIELYAKKVNFIVCNLHLNKGDCRGINKDTKRQGLQKNKSQTNQNCQLSN